MYADPAYPPEYPVVPPTSPSLPPPRSRPVPTVSIPPRPRRSVSGASELRREPVPPSPPGVMPIASAPVLPPRRLSTPPPIATLTPEPHPLPLFLPSSESPSPQPQRAPSPVRIRRPRELDLLDVASTPPHPPRNEFDTWVVARLEAATTRLSELTDAIRDAGQASNFGVLDYPEFTAPAFVQGSSHPVVPRPPPDGDAELAAVLAQSEVPSRSLSPFSEDEEAAGLRSEGKGKERAR